MLSKKVLVIDDDPDFVKMISMRLTASGYEVVTAGDGKKGLSQVIMSDPDLIILDSLMPVMNGFQFMQKYEESERMRKIPVIVVSEKESVRDFFKDMLIKDFIVKPLDMDVFLAKVGKLVGKTEIAAGSTATSKRLLLIGVDKFITNKINDFFKSAGWEVFFAKNDIEAYKTARTLFPDAILCQYWNPEWEGGELDTKLLGKRLAEDHSLERIHFVVYCPHGAILEAIEVFPEFKLIKYTESDDLLKEIAKRFGIYSR